MKVRPWYDNKNGMKRSLRSLANFYRLNKIRHDAYLKGKQITLSAFFVLGRFFLDKAGNCALLEVPRPEDLFGEIPDILSLEEFTELMKKRGGPTRFLAKYNSGPPPAHIKCYLCKEKWTIGNCHDVVVVKNIVNVNLEIFYGKTLCQVYDIYRKKTDGVYEIFSLITKNTHWQKSNGELNGRYIIMHEDLALCIISYFYHKKCAESSNISV